MICKMCNKERDLRLGWCWDCASAQNILSTGKDMHEDEDSAEFEVPVAVANARLKKMIDKGWHTGV